MASSAVTRANGSRPVPQHDPDYPYIGTPAGNSTTAMADDAIHWMNQLNDIVSAMPSFSMTFPAARIRRTIRRRNGSRKSATASLR